MKPFIGIIVLFFLPVHFAFCQKHIIIEGKGMDSVILIGKAKTEIKKLFGNNYSTKCIVIKRRTDSNKPSRKKHGRNKNLMDYTNLGMTVILYNKKAYTIDFDSAEYITSKGITIGSKISDVGKAYGNPGKDWGGKIQDCDNSLCEYSNLGIDFYFKDGAVLYISIYAPR